MFGIPTCSIWIKVETLSSSNVEPDTETPFSSDDRRDCCYNTLLKYITETICLKFDNLTPDSTRLSSRRNAVPTHPVGQHLSQSLDQYRMVKSDSLQVVVMKAEGLETASGATPEVQVELRAIYEEEEVSVRTTTIARPSLDPVWEQQYTFPVRLRLAPTHLILSCLADLSARFLQ
eukprot:3597969-Rhodomonas_salina.1